MSDVSYAKLSDEPITTHQPVRRYMQGGLLLLAVLLSTLLLVVYRLGGSAPWLCTSSGWNITCYEYNGITPSGLQIPSADRGHSSSEHTTLSQVSQVDTSRSASDEVSSSLGNLSSPLLSAESLLKQEGVKLYKFIEALLNNTGKPANNAESHSFFTNHGWESDDYSSEEVTRYENGEQYTSSFTTFEGTSELTDFPFDVTASILTYESSATTTSLASKTTHAVTTAWTPYTTHLQDNYNYYERDGTEPVKFLSQLTTFQWNKYFTRNFEDTTKETQPEYFYDTSHPTESVATGPGTVKISDAKSFSFTSKHTTKAATSITENKLLETTWNGNFEIVTSFSNDSESVINSSLSITKVSEEKGFTSSNSSATTPISLNNEFENTAKFNAGMRDPAIRSEQRRSLHDNTTEDIAAVSDAEVFDNSEAWQSKTSRTQQQNFADDVREREEAFTDKYVNCAGDKTNATLSVAQSCALKLRVAKAARDSLNFTLLNQKQTTAWLVSQHDSPAPRDQQHIKNILYWVEKDPPVYTRGPEFFQENQCPVSNCRVIADRSLVRPDDVHAIVLHSWWLLRSPRPVKLPSKREFVNAKMILQTGEAPIRHPGNFHAFDGLIDYTFGYRRDSDIVKTRGSVVPRSWTPTTGDVTPLPLASSKTKMAAWFVSNCHDAPSGRMKLAMALRRHGVEVDIFGGCGNATCAPAQDARCYEMLHRNYKFYLSFENSLCNHYVTEKFYNILKYDVVPVTYGLGHELTGAPRDAYVDALDFPDIATLAKHLLYLNANATAYNAYFRWKKFYEVQPHYGRRSALCQLCEVAGGAVPPLRQYPNMAAWQQQGQCLDARHDLTIRDFLDDRQ
ncbi:uncharacterized protein LOC108676301 [Hyalella azteca]|uniref:Fucosyltransferase n=1 Tax=Hyalella azteca TaxID=294128 RepID=A0A8B7P472_HYAAZ|nr:uncharacterized protein LOC108676301 [Hyalella azteca]